MRRHRVQVCGLIISNANVPTAKQPAFLQPPGHESKPHTAPQSSVSCRQQQLSGVVANVVQWGVAKKMRCRSLRRWWLIVLRGGGTLAPASLRVFPNYRLVDKCTEGGVGCSTRRSNVVRPRRVIVLAEMSAKTHSRGELLLASERDVAAMSHTARRLLIGKSSPVVVWPSECLRRAMDRIDPRRA